MDKILEEFKDRATIHGSIFFFNVQDSLKIIARCKELNRRIKRIETFILTDTTTQPQDYMIYAGGLYDSIDGKRYFELYHIQKNSDKGHWAEATHYIKEKAKINPDYFFDIGYEGNY
jgi:hypothetical protein